MRRTSKLIVLALLWIAVGMAPGRTYEAAQHYSETRHLLLQMDRSSGNKALRRLFREADVRMADLLAAVDDETEKVTINAQVILRYFGDAEALRAMEDRLELRMAQGKKTVSPVIDPVETETYLDGSDSDPVTAVKRNARLFRASKFNSGHTKVRLLAYNKKARAALIELVEGEIFTSGWHTVIKQEGSRWRLITDTNIWVH